MATCMQGCSIAASMEYRSSDDNMISVLNVDIVRSLR